MSHKFSLEHPTLTFGGVFYPRDWVVLMFAEPVPARRVMTDLKTGGYADEDVIYVDAATILAQIAITIGASDGTLPSVGSERGIVRRHEELARQGHVAVMVYAPSEDETHRVMRVAQRSTPSYAQKYRRFVIEDLL